MINTRINQLILYGMHHHLIGEKDRWYTINLLLDLFGLNSFEAENVEEISKEEILTDMLDYAIQQGLIEDSITQKDLFDSRIMNCLMPRPSEVISQFNRLYQESPLLATDYYYQLACDSNYIRMARIRQNIEFRQPCKYGELQITINLSKPEKDPRDIAKARFIQSSDYPKCLLCRENEGYAGNLSHPSRINHRLIPLILDHQRYYLQYSPYVYYNEHCIVLNENHIPMKIDRHTFIRLFDFIDQFPHYMIGSNADLPIVGGSILSHDHFQGGKHHFPIEDASTIETRKIGNIQLEMLNWPLSTIRLTGDSKDEIIDLAERILNHWISYNDESLEIIACEGDVRHNTVTPIARKKGNQYQIDLVLRNNRTNEQYPLGIFHPHPENHHIKKENIGLIEVMGLAILPGRLKNELAEIRKCLLEKKTVDSNSIEKHSEWVKYLQKQEYNEENIDIFLQKEITKKFTSVLENAGVFKMNEKGIQGFERFIDSI